MKRFLKDNKGVTLLEGLIALLLLALVATGTFGVLLSTSRRSSQPDIREEMSLAIERAMNKLQVYVYTTKDTSGDKVLISTLPEDVRDGLCGTVASLKDSDPLKLGQHNIQCMLPPLCDVNKSSSFYYTVTAMDDFNAKSKLKLHDIGTGQYISLASPYSIQFEIQCNGYKL